MHSLIRFSLKQRVFYNLMFVVLMVAGVYAMFSMPAERYPNINLGKVMISTYFPGASPEEVETLVTHEIEEALESVNNIEWIKSTSFRERSLVRIKFVDDSDYQALYTEVRLNVLNQLGELPDAVDPPSISDLKVEDFLPVITVNLSGEQSNRSLTLMAKTLKILLLNIPGVQEVQLHGELEREFHIVLDPVQLKAFGITFDQVAKRLEERNLTLPAGDFTTDSGIFIIKVDERFESREQVVSTIIRTDRDGSHLRLRQLIRHANLGYRDPLALASINGIDSVSLSVIKSASSSALTIKNGIDKVLEKYRPIAESEGVQLTLTDDSTVKIEDGFNTLKMNMLIGITLVTLVVWNFMGIRNAGLVTIGIPFSFLISMLLMYLTGNSLNEMTLFSFVLMTGIIVDDAIVVTENIYRHVQQGEPLEQAIVAGTAEVALPVISATLTTVAAFLPMLMMTGTTGEFFALIPKAVAFSIFASLVECLLILPIHYLDFGPSEKSATTETVEQQDNWILKLFRIITTQVLRLTLRFRFTSLAILSLLFILATLILGVSISGRFPLIKIKFFPDDYTIYYVDLKGPGTTPIEEVDRRVKAIARFIMADGPGMAKSAAGIAGFYFNDDYEMVHGAQFGAVVVALPSKAQQQFDQPMDHLDQMRQRIKEQFENDGFTIRVKPQKDGPPQGKALNVRVAGTNLNAIDSLENTLMGYIRNSPSISPWLVDLEDDRGRLQRVFQLVPKTERIHEHGLNDRQVIRLAAAVLDGRYIGRYQLNDQEIDLKLYLETGKTPSTALAVPMIEDASGPIRLGDLVEARSYYEASELNRYRGQRAITITANIKPDAPTSTPAIVNQIKQHYLTIADRYPGATLSFAGEYADTQRSYQSLAYAFILAVLVIYIILSTQFQSYLQPLIILSAIIFALIGVVFGKFITQSVFTINSFIAVLGVAGVVVNDALVLIDFINKRYRAGMSRREAIDEGVRVRLRPIVLTTLTTSLGLLPMALGIPSYSIVWGSMASTFVTGLTTATMLTLIIVPVLWDLLQQWQERRMKSEV